MAKEDKKYPLVRDGLPVGRQRKQRFSALTGKPAVSQEEALLERMQQEIAENPQLKQKLLELDLPDTEEALRSRTGRMPSRPESRPPIPSRPEPRPPMPSRPESRPPMPSRPESRPPMPSRPESRPPMPSRPNARPEPDLEQLIRNLQQQLRSRELELKQSRSEAEALKKQVEELKQLAQNDRDEETRALLMQVQEEKRRLAAAYTSLKDRIDGSYSADELAAYFGRAIDTFNDRMNDQDDHMPAGALQGSVGYIINGMDVDLKAQVVKNEKTDELLFLSDPSVSGPESMSTVRISIKAYPKGIPEKGGR